MLFDPDSLPPIDRARLKRASGGDPSLERELIVLFMREVADRLARLNHALGQGDFAHARLEAHTIKGAAANLGAEPMRARAELLEHLLASHAALESPRAFQDLQDEFQTLCRELGGAQPDREGHA